MGKRISFAWECIRKALHLSSLVILVLYTGLLNHFSDRVAILVLTAILLLLLEIERIRLEHRPGVMKFFDGLIRSSEKNHISGPAYFIIATIISFAAFEYWIALTAMFMAIFGDMFAALFGRAFGRSKIYRNKTWVGTLSAFLANILVGMFLLPDFMNVYVPMAVMATLVELLTHKLDDNLTVPLFAGFLGQIIVYYTVITLPPIDFTFMGLF